MTGDVETVDVDDDLATAARLMLENKYGCVPVLEEGLLAGILTEADFVRLAADDAAVGS
jgi:CBS domain-containing protein